MISRSHYLPRVVDLDKLPDHDRAAVLDFHRRQIEEEVGRTVLATCKGRRQFLKSARDRMRRLERLAHSYGYWLPDPSPTNLAEALAKIDEIEAALIRQIKCNFTARYSA